MAVKYDIGVLRQNLIRKAQEASGELTRVFFDHVDKHAPVEDGHLHQTLGSGLNQTGLPETGEVVTAMLSKGSGDPTATAAGSGSTTLSDNSVHVVVRTTLGFVSKLNDGGFVEPDVNGSKGFKEGGVATKGVLYAPRKDSGPMGFLSWSSGGKQYFTRSAVWEPQGFFDGAAVALRNKAQEMGFE